MALGAAVMVLGNAGVSAAVAGECQMPAPFGIRVDQRQGDASRGPGLFAVSAQPAAADLVPGDAIRQANGARVERCADIERVAEEALSSGLVLLLAVEREGAITAVAVMAQSPLEQVNADPRSLAIEPSRSGGGGGNRPALAREQPASDVPPPSQLTPAPRPPVPTRTPRTSAEVVLPPPAEASASARSCAEEAVAELRSLDRMAQLSVPLVSYDRRLRDATAGLTGLHCGEDRPGATALSYIAETLGYYRTASDIRHFSADFQSRHQVDVRSGEALTMPYHTDSEVTRWVEVYPFLRASLLEAPRETRFPIPGEAAGRWSPDRGAELLWEHARSRVSRLAEWAATPG